MKQSDWMKGLLWAESNLSESELFHLCSKGACNSYQTFMNILVSKGFDNTVDMTKPSYYTGILDYLKHYKERLL